MKTSVKGLHDIVTTRGLTSRSVPATRVQVAAELARAEHERARLERELTMWAANRRQAERRLHRARERIRTLQRALAKQPGREKGRRYLARPVRRVVPLEY